MKPTPIHRDEITAHIARLRTFLGMMEAAQPRTADPEAMRRAGFNPDPRPPIDPFAGRRTIAWFEEREARRRARCP